MSRPISELRGDGCSVCCQTAERTRIHRCVSISSRVISTACRPSVHSAINFVPPAAVGRARRWSESNGPPLYNERPTAPFKIRLIAAEAQSRRRTETAVDVRRTSCCELIPSVQD